MNNHIFNNDVCNHNELTGYKLLYQSEHKGCHQPELVVLFDISKGWQLGNNAFNGPDMVIERLSAHYQ